MYAWIWRRLPFGLPGKIIGSVLLTLATVALLWYVVFPWAEPILPFDDVQVGTEGNSADLNPAPGEGNQPRETARPGETGQPGDGHDIPYDQQSNNPVPTPSR
jgi:hypothetical protein